MDTKENEMFQNFADKESTRQIKESDDGFFEKFGELKEHAEPSEEIINEEFKERIEYQKNEAEPEEETVKNKLIREEEKISLRRPPKNDIQVEQLYPELLYECQHMIGKDASSTVKKDVLCSFLKNVFELDDSAHKAMMDIAKSKQPVKMVLNVEVVEAKDLTPKDANGLSDPFCVLWISSNSTERFFSSTKTGTLKPFWEEHFKMPLVSANHDILNLEVWDFDAAETVKDKLQKVKEVKGIWGVGKLIKEIATTTATGKHDNEFIGSVQVSLKNLPACGQTAWFNLRKKSKNTNQGMILLKMMFGSEKDTAVALEEHRRLIRALLKFRIKSDDGFWTDWDGKFSTEADMIMRQHLVQSNLGATDELLAKWIEYCQIHMTNPLNFILLDDLLAPIAKALQNELLTEDEKKLFWEAARKILPSCYNSIRRIRKSTPGDVKVKYNLSAVLSILSMLSNCSMPKGFKLFSKNVYGWLTAGTDIDIKAVLHDAVIQGAVDWFIYLINHNIPEDNTDEGKLRQMIKIVQLINLDLRGAMDHHEQIFEEKLQFPYSRTLYTVYECKISNEVKPAVSEMCGTMRPLDFEKLQDKDANNDPLSMGTAMFELYLALQAINSIGKDLFDEEEADKFLISEYYEWFKIGVVRWLDIAAYKALQRIEKAVELDKFIREDENMYYSSSAIDTMAIYHQVSTFWQQLAWPDVEGSYTFIAKIIDDICRCSGYYADQIALKVENYGDIDNPYGRRFQVTDEWCMAINNIEYIQENIKPFVMNQLGLDKTLNSLADFKSTVTAEHCRNVLQLVMDSTLDTVSNKIAALLEKVATKMVPAMVRLLQEGAEILHQESNVIDRLMQYLDENLTKLSTGLNSVLFERILSIIWHKVSHIVKDITEDAIAKKKPPSYFANLRKTLEELVGFFNPGAENKIEEITNRSELLTKVHRILFLYGMETEDLIHYYHLYRLEEQKTIDTSDDGIMSVRLQLVKNDLHIEVLNASKIRTMDSNGLCDPFVSISLIPKYKFPSTKVKTKVHKKTLCPLFEEKFKISLTDEQLKVKDALVMFVMKDQDLFGAKNVYMAEAYVGISEVPVADEVSIDWIPQKILYLNRPSTTENEMLKVLDGRHGDKQAKDFIKREKIKMEIPQ